MGPAGCAANPLGLKANLERLFLRWGGTAPVSLRESYRTSATCAPRHVGRSYCCGADTVNSFDVRSSCGSGVASGGTSP